MEDPHRQIIALCSLNTLFLLSWTVSCFSASRGSRHTGMQGGWRHFHYAGSTEDSILLCPHLRLIPFLSQNNGLVHQNKGLVFLNCTKPLFCARKSNALNFKAIPSILGRTGILTLKCANQSAALLRRRMKHHLLPFSHYASSRQYWGAYQTCVVGIGHIWYAYHYCRGGRSARGHSLPLVCMSCTKHWKCFMIKFETGVSFCGVIKQPSGWCTSVWESLYPANNQPAHATGEVEGM